MHLIPYPKVVQEEQKKFDYRTICVREWPSDERLKKALGKLPLAEDGAELTLCITGDAGEGYQLRVDDDNISLTAESLQAAFYGVQTLRQIFAHKEIPCLYIEDKPDFPHRGFYHDVTRGKIPTVATLKGLIDQMAYYKMNSLELYVEHTFAFREYADSIGRTGCLTAEEIRELDDYCYENFIEFIPSLSTFGHLYELLRKERYQHLTELENFQEDRAHWILRQVHHTIDPTNPESFALIQSLIDQYLPLFRSDKFNICCDETFDLTDGKHKGQDTGTLYVEFVKKITSYIQSKGKKVMMWADVLLHHPEKIAELPKDIILLNWDYRDAPEEENVAKIQKQSFSQILCPGTSTWNRLCENVDRAEKNISRMADFAYRYGAQGILNTNWGDYGNPCSLELAMHGMLVGAEKSWSVSTSLGETFEKNLDFLLYQKEGTAARVRTLSLLHQETDWGTFVRCYSNLCFREQIEATIPEQEALRSTQQECLAMIKDLESAGCDNEYYQELQIAAEGTALMAELFAKLGGYPLERVVDTEAWLKKYRQKWVEKNKESELFEIEKMFRCIENA